MHNITEIEQIGYAMCYVKYKSIAVYKWGTWGSVHSIPQDLHLRQNQLASCMIKHKDNPLRKMKFCSGR